MPIKHDKKLSAQPEADQLWRDFDNRLDAANDENLLNLWDDDLLSIATKYENIQCLNYKALLVIMGKVQVLQGAIQLLQAKSEMPERKLQLLHARLQVLCGNMLPYLAVRIKQSPLNLLESVTEACRTTSSEQVSGEAPAALQQAAGTDAGEAQSYPIVPSEDEGPARRRRRAG
jgi:hypothetical protein